MNRKQMKIHSCFLVNFIIFFLIFSPFSCNLSVDFLPYLNTYTDRGLEYGAGGAAGKASAKAIHIPIGA